VAPGMTIGAGARLRASIDPAYEVSAGRNNRKLFAVLVAGLYVKAFGTSLGRVLAGVKSVGALGGKDLFELVPPVPENMLFKLLTPFSGLQSATMGARSKSL